MQYFTALRTSLLAHRTNQNGVVVVELTGNALIRILGAVPPLLFAPAGWFEGITN